MFQKLLTKIANELERLRLPYMVIGGQAILLYGELRLTKDIDITLGVGVEQKKHGASGLTIYSFVEYHPIGYLPSTLHVNNCLTLSRLTSIRRPADWFVSLIYRQS